MYSKMNELEKTIVREYEKAVEERENLCSELAIIGNDPIKDREINKRVAILDSILPKMEEGYYRIIRKYNTNKIVLPIDFFK